MTRLAVEPTPVQVPDEVLADLRRRLLATKLPLDAGNQDGYYGVRRSYLQELVAYWADGFDWRAAERAINAYENYRVEVAGVPVHFLRRPGVGPDPVPLILSHGWPWTFWHSSKVIDALADPGAFGGDPADAFEVIVPSLPGFGFSTPLPERPDMNFWKMADVWHELMTGVLGHEKYAAAGCDVGALVTGQLGHKYADELYAIHIGSALKLTLFNGDLGWNISSSRPLPENLPPAIRAGVIATQKKFAVHLAAHTLDPSTLAYGLADSPAGMLAWLLERWDSWSDDHGDVETGVMSAGNGYKYPLGTVAAGDTELARGELAGAPYGWTLSGRVFDRVDLNSVLMKQLSPERCTFIGTDLRHATLAGCHFTFCNFRDAMLRSASMREAGFAGCDFRTADLRDTDLTGTRFGYVLTGTDTGRTDPTGTLLSGASLWQ